jgi:hypothetical protein
MLRKTNVELENLTPELAKKFATMDKLPGERPLKAKRLKFFEDHIKEGTFIDPSWSIGICKADGKTYRLDGQHTSTILASLSADIFPQNKLATIVSYEFDSIEEDAPMLFDTFDNPQSARNNEEMMGVFRSSHSDMDELSNSLCVNVANGIFHYESGQAQGVIYPTRVRGLYFADQRNIDFAQWIKSMFDDEAVKNGWLLSKSGIISEMLADWILSAEVATEFWSYVLKENHADPDNITRELAEDLKRWRVKQERRSQEEYRTRAQKSWKRYRKEMELDKAA